MRRGQQGLTLMGFIVVLIVLGFFAYLAMRLIPMYTEYFQIVKAMDAVVKDPIAASADDHKVQDMISRHFEIGYVDSITPKDIKMKHEQNGLTLSVSYEVRKPLFYNIFIVGHFEKVLSTVPSKIDAGGG